MDDTLVKIRMPSTTMTAVCSWEPTPSWLPRKTNNVAVITFEGNHEDLIGKATLKIGSGGTEQRIERRQHHNRQIRLKRNGNVRPDEHANDHAYDKSQDRCHYLTFLAYVTSPVTAASSVIDLLLLTCG